MMSEEAARIMTGRDFAEFLCGMAGQLREGDWEPSTDDLSESLYGMAEHLDNTSSTDTRDGMTWEMIAAMILAGMKKTKAYHINIALSQTPADRYGPPGRLLTSID